MLSRILPAEPSRASREQQPSTCTAKTNVSRKHGPAYYCCCCCRCCWAGTADVPYLGSQSPSEHIFEVSTARRTASGMNPPPKLARSHPTDCPLRTEGRPFQPRWIGVNFVGFGLNLLTSFRASTSFRRPTDRRADRSVGEQGYNERRTRL